MIKEFREFIVRGNVVDMAVGIIIGGVFGKIVASLVNDVLMPPIGMLLAKVDFRDLAVVMREAQGDKPAVKISYGAFVNSVIDFLIVSFVIFLLVKGINRLRRQPVPPAPPPPNTHSCPQCLMPIPLQAKRCGHCTSEVRPV